MSQAASSEIDFSAYNRPELVEEISSVISLPRAVGTVFLWCFCAVPVTLVAVGLLAYQMGTHWSLAIVSVCYSLPAALLLGAMTGVFRAICKSLDSLVNVVDTTLEIAESAAADITDLSSGTKRIPSARQIIYGVYEHVALPALEGAARGQSRWLGGLLFRAYRWSAGRMVTRLLRDAPHPAETEEKIRETVDEIAANVDLKKAAEARQAWIGDVRTYLVAAGSTMRRIIILPLAVMLSVCILIGIVPLALMLWFGS